MLSGGLEFHTEMKQLIPNSVTFHSFLAVMPLAVFLARQAELILA